MDISEAKQRITIHEIWERLNLPGAHGHTCKSPFREDRKPSFSVSKDGQLFNDFASGEGGDVLDFFTIATGLEGAAAISKFIEFAGGSKSTPAAPRQAQPRAQEARQKPTFPDFERGTDEQLQRLAALRKVSFPALYMARHCGLLRFKTWHGREAWIVTDNERLNAQARRLDGAPWEEIKAKAWTLSDSWASWPLGIRTGAQHDNFLLVEGGGDLLAALDFLYAADEESRIFPLAMLGASQRIHEDALPLLAGKRVRIFPHDDEAGTKAALRWTQQLESVGATVDCFSFNGLRKLDGSPVNDMNDVTQIHPDDEHELKTLLEL